MVTRNLIDEYILLQGKISVATDRALMFYKDECDRLNFKKYSWFIDSYVTDVREDYVYLERCFGIYYDDVSEYKIPIEALFDDTYQEVITNYVTEEIVNFLASDK